MADANSTDYAHPEVLVTTDWVAEHLDDPNIRIMDVSEDVLLYDTGHIPARSKLTGWVTSGTTPSANSSNPKNSPNCSSV